MAKTRPWTPLEPDQALLQQATWLCGMDEVGRGCVAGPICIAAVIVTATTLPLLRDRVRDSKLMTEKARRESARLIRDHFPHQLFFHDAPEIDTRGINVCNREAFLQGYQWATQSQEGAGIALADGNLDGCEGIRCLIKGEMLSAAIAAASILAKVARDQLMCQLASQHPHYLFERHKGYGTAAHLEVIRRHGIIDGLHRRSFLTRI